MNNNIEGFHATTKKAAIEISDTQKFKSDDRNSSKKFLGRGVYFYLDRANAIDWTIKMYKDNHEDKLPQESSEIIENYRIVNANIEANEKRILDLDKREAIKKLDIMAELVKKSLGKYSTQYNDKPVAVLLNYLERKNFICDIDIVMKTFPYPVNSNDFLRGINKINKTMICVKNNNVISDAKISKKITQKEYNFSMLIY